MKKSFISSVAPRAMRLIGMATQVASKEVAQNARDALFKAADEVASGRIKTRIQQAKIIAENLSHLKGAAMKAGQLLSLDAAEYFPPEAVEILSKLQAQADPMPFEALRSVIEEELGPNRLESLAMLDPNPVASASVGQVHVAFVDGRKVAVKVQYPGVAESIDSDLAILRRVAGSLAALSGRKLDLGPLFEEFRTVLAAEVDYRLEADCLREYRKLLGEFAYERPVGSGIPFFIVPEVLPEHSARRVLAMSWEEGLRLTDWMRLSGPAAPSRAERTAVAQALLDLYCEEFFRWGFVQTDPNFGNFLVRRDPLQIVLLDFGATLRYPEEFRRSYVEILKSFAARDPDRTFDLAVKFGLMDAREGPEARGLFHELMANALEPFSPERQPFAFQDADYAARARRVTLDFVGSLRYTPPPRQIIFLHRKLGGLFALMKRLEIEIDLVPYWRRMVGGEMPSRPKQ